MNLLVEFLHGMGKLFVTNSRGESWQALPFFPSQDIAVRDPQLVAPGMGCDQLTSPHHTVDGTRVDNHQLCRPCSCEIFSSLVFVLFFSHGVSSFLRLWPMGVTVLHVLPERSCRFIHSSRHSTCGALSSSSCFPLTTVAEKMPHSCQFSPNIFREIGQSARFAFYHDLPERWRPVHLYKDTV
jgi:hypothetical protein